MKSFISGLIFFVSLMSICFASPQIADKKERPKPLQAELAFNLQVAVIDSEHVQASWQIAPGYYLYRDRFDFQFSPQTHADVKLPPGHVKLLTNNRQEEVYDKNLIVPITLPANQKNIQLKVNYQGCSEFGFCYPPIKKTFDLQLENNPQAASVQSSALSLKTLLTNQNQVRSILEVQSLWMVLVIFAIIGLMLAFTPCVFPMIPIITSIIVGQKEKVTTQKAFFLSLTYVLGTSVAYALAGVAAAYFGRSLQMLLQLPWVIVLFSSIFMLLALALFGVFELRLPRFWQNKISGMSHKQKSGSYVGVFIMGFLSTLIVSPCVTAPLIGVLMYIAEKGNVVLGASALFVMSLGMGIPLILIGISAGKWLPKRGQWMIVTQKIFGILMVGMAAWLLSRMTSSIVVALFCSSYLLIGFIYSKLMKDSKQSLFRFHASFSLSILLVIAITIMSVPYFKINAVSNEMLASSEAGFKSVKNIDEINRQLMLAKLSGKPVMLDFYADWCESCIAMDKKVFSAATVMNKLSPFIILRADLSENNANDEAILKRYSVIAPPTVLFFDKQGEEVSTYRIVGELDVKEFMTHINTFFAAKCDQKFNC